MVAEIEIYEAAIVVSHRIPVVETYRVVEVPDGRLGLTEAGVRGAPIVVGIGVRAFKTDGLVVVS